MLSIFSNVTKGYSISTRSSKLAIYYWIASVLVVLSGCTTLVAHNAIDPYTSDKSKREALESIAAGYCSEKQALSEPLQNNVLPDYPFTTDGCSRWFDSNWASCCVVHDIQYWCGGSYEDRLEADNIMMQCANQKTTMMGGIMLLGVRVGGSPWLPTPWRWGYGWKKWPRGYQTVNHRPSIKNILNKLHIPDAVEEQLK